MEQKIKNRKNFKVVVVGDGACGKTSILLRFINEEFNAAYTPTVFETQNAEFCVKDTLVNLTLWDTAGQEDYARLRPLAYEGTDIVILCYSISSQDSFNNLTNWLKEIKHFLYHAPIVLVGCKMDLRQTQDKPNPNETGRETAFLQTKEGEDFGKAHNMAFVECSSLTGEGIEKVFHTAAEVALSHEHKKKIKVCNIL